MHPKAIEQLVIEQAEAVAKELGIEVVDVEFQPGPRGRVLRVFIDKPGGVSVEDCRAVSVPLSGALDRLDPIPGPYRLEVSSPGVERPLRKAEDFERFAGREVEVHTYGPVEGRRHFTGRLKGLAGDRVQLEMEDGSMVALPREGISRARLRVRWQGAVER
ncbi:MAG: ribosome maturation factor RimP [Limnochordaceae bacterium]|uniref:Ribosome maturation factor RimP n=1 Tax=Carboxydichorda subterranea TaxID=3109565 RepID=A0ABZ1C2Y7_9FIRM|nr:ribosome maturation factor RimP [Limnochorda sp. L945t]MBE3597993.1 ribosome maturation factor RimP [Limnochordaceae bacterium]WRP18478.1 ribosome maturation factor RimP [Limnochorda sp. L945t]